MITVSAFRWVPPFAQGQVRDLRTGRVQVLLGLAYVRPLRDQLRGQAQRQVLRQLQARKLELLGQVLAGVTAGQSR